MHDFDLKLNNHSNRYNDAYMMTILLQEYISKMDTVLSKGKLILDVAIDNKKLSRAAWRPKTPWEQGFKQSITGRREGL